MKAGFPDDLDLPKGLEQKEVYQQYLK